MNSKAELNQLTVGRVVVTRELEELEGQQEADWIQGYMYTLGRRGLRVSNSPVSS